MTNEITVTLFSVYFKFNFNFTEMIQRSILPEHQTGRGFDRASRRRGLLGTYALLQIIRAMPIGLQSFFFRTSNGTECDLVLVKAPTSPVSK